VAKGLSSRLAPAGRQRPGLPPGPPRADGVGGQRAGGLRAGTRDLRRTYARAGTGVITRQGGRGRRSLPGRDVARQSCPGAPRTVRRAGPERPGTTGEQPRSSWHLSRRGGALGPRSALEDRLLAEAASISEKYECPPHTTDFAVMYLPTEGLFAEVVRAGAYLRLEHEVVVAGPTTLTALLGSLSMGFRSLAIQKRSSEAWEVPRAGEKSGGVWEKVSKQLGRQVGRCTTPVSVSGPPLRACGPSKQRPRPVRRRGAVGCDRRR
jgi:hypothetical protein